jgi:hypothetical protein
MRPSRLLKVLKLLLVELFEIRLIDVTLSIAQFSQSVVGLLSQPALSSQQVDDLLRLVLAQLVHEIAGGLKHFGDGSMSR